MNARVHIAVYDENPLSKQMTVCYAEVNAEVPEEMSSEQFVSQLIVNLSAQVAGEPVAMRTLYVKKPPVLPDELPPEPDA